MKEYNNVRSTRKRSRDQANTEEPSYPSPANTGDPGVAMYMKIAEGAEARKGLPPLPLRNFIRARLWSRGTHKGTQAHGIVSPCNMESRKRERDITARAVIPAGVLCLLGPSFFLTPRCRAQLSRVNEVVYMDLLTAEGEKCVL